MDNIYLRVHQHEGGFFSNFNKIATYLSDYPNVSKITWHLYGQPYGAFAYNCGELFSNLFKTYQSEKESNLIVDLQTYNRTTYTGKDIHYQYISNNTEWRYNLNKTLKYFIPTGELQSLITTLDNILNNIKPKKLIGVLKRNNRLSCEQQNNTLPTIERYFEEIDKIFDDETYVCLSVDNVSDLNQFIKKYKRCIFNPKIRRTQTVFDEEPHFLPGSKLDAMYTYLEVYMLSKCQTFIHPVSNMATASLYFNPQQQSIYI